MLVEQSRVSEVLGGEVVEAVDCHASTSQDNSLHVSAFSPSESDNSLPGKGVKGVGVDTLLVDDHESLVGLSAYLSLQGNDLKEGWRV